MKQINFNEFVENLTSYEFIYKSGPIDVTKIELIILDILEKFWNLEIDESIIKNDIKTKPYKFRKKTERYSMKTLTKLEFSSLYPSIISNEIKNDKLKFNYKNIGNLFLYLYDKRIEIKKSNNPSAYLLCKFILNVIYGIIFSSKKLKIFSNATIEPFIDLNNLFEKHGEFLGLIYADVDILLFDLSSDDNIYYFEKFIDYIRREKTYLKFDLEEVYEKDINIKK